MPVILTEAQRIPTSGARAAEPVPVAGFDLLAIPQLARDSPGAPPGMNGGDSDTELLLLRRHGGTYVPWRTLPAPGGEDAEFFTVGDRSFAVASIRTGDGPYNFEAKSTIFEWQGGRFLPFQDVPTHHRGRKSGRERVTPVMYLPHDSEAGIIYVFATKAGAPTSPDWYYNLTAAGEGSVERGTETYQVTVRELSGAERDRVYAEQARRYPGFAGYARQQLESVPFPCSNLAGHSPRPRPCAGGARHGRYYTDDCLRTRKRRMVTAPCRTLSSGSSSIRAVPGEE